MKNTVLYGDERKSITEYHGRFLVGDCANILGEFPNNTVDLVFTSPPYADQDKAYKNKESKIHPDKYIDWFMPIANELYRVLKDNGSFILNINDKVVNHFQHLYVFEILLKLCKETGFNLVRDYIWHNPCTPPNVFSKGKLGRTKKSHEYVFWFSKGEKWTFEIEPILKPYSKKMKNIINGMSSEQKKGIGSRCSPSRHYMNYKKNWTDRGGSDPGSVLTISPSISNSYIQQISKEMNIIHPARFPEKLAEFFILSGSHKGDVVLDPFMGSGTTAAVCEKNGRHWIGIDLSGEYCNLANARIQYIRTHTPPSLLEQE